MPKKLDAETQAALDLSLEALQATDPEANESDALRWALLAHAHCIREQKFVLSGRELLERAAAYAAYVLSHREGKHFQAVVRDDGMPAVPPVALH